jgi:hypothetical protein
VSTKKDVKKLLKEAIRQGFDVHQSHRGHYRVTAPTGVTATVSKTPSCPRTLDNTRADLRRIGVTIPH